MEQQLTNLFPDGKVPKDYVHQLVSNAKSNIAISEKDQQQQDRLEQAAATRLSQLRGDASLARTENQRDAAIQAYNTIERIKQEGRQPSQLEYYDILGQMWKARTGASPTDQALRDLDQKTLHGDLGRAYQYFSGEPAGATTEDVLQNLQDFAADSGKQADKFHEAYMQSHKIKPSGLSEERWKPLLQTERGLTFQEATGYGEKPKKNTSTQGGDTGGYIATATNPTTGHKIGTKDGKTWGPIQ